MHICILFSGRRTCGSYLRTYKLPRDAQGDPYGTRTWGVRRGTTLRVPIFAINSFNESYNIYGGGGSLYLSDPHDHFGIQHNILPRACINAHYKLR